ncbi:hypothetical protein VNO77_05496 [Canavalia gladiata]|uniref:Uncharacterized protein n=1 Tax=Canavalia gladiata TaxID=3824 RepID=A0AAN9N0I1_CANGL
MMPVRSISRSEANGHRHGKQNRIISLEIISVTQCLSFQHIQKENSIQNDNSDAETRTNQAKKHRISITRSWSSNSVTDPQSNQPLTPEHASKDNNFLGTETSKSRNQISQLLQKTPE